MHSYLVKVLPINVWIAKAFRLEILYVTKTNGTMMISPKSVSFH